MFPPEVKIKAMLACGRRCCLCHKFAGVGMECHHITPQAKGGENIFSNCIPLCFDCHAEVGHYSDDHPKGTKFSPDELLGHRDHWYATYANGTGPTAPTGYEELDKKLFLRLYELLGGSSTMIHFRNHDYQNSYEEEIEHRLWRFTDKASLPETEFFDAQLAAAFGDLCAAIRSYEKDAEGCIWHDHQKAHVPPEWAESQEDRFEEAVDKMNKAATKIWEAFSQFVKTARVRLKIEHEAVPPTVTEPKKEESPSRTDLDLFRKYISHFAPDGIVINFLKHHDMAVPIHKTCIEPLWTYSDIWRGPKYEFLFSELELARVTFDRKIREFIAHLVSETAPSDIPNFYTMDFKDAEYRPEKLMAQKTLNRLSTDAAQAYEDLYRAGKSLFRNENIDSGSE